MGTTERKQLRLLNLHSPSTPPRPRTLKTTLDFVVHAAPCGAEQVIKD